MSSVYRVWARLPWFAPAAVAGAGMLMFAVLGNALIGVYFERSTLAEANPLQVAAGAPAASKPADSTGTQVGAYGDPASPVTPAADAAQPTILLKGKLQDGAPGHHGRGGVTIGRDAAGRLVLVLDDFSVTNGPDLHVIIGPDPKGGGNGLDLGKLKATDGTFSYVISEGNDLSQFASVTIFCKSFPTIFAYATLAA